MMKKYEIAFVGLKNKVHHIAFEVDNTFFEEIEHCPIKKGDLNTQEKRFYKITLEYLIRVGKEYLRRIRTKQTRNSINKTRRGSNSNIREYMKTEIIKLRALPDQYSINSLSPDASLIDYMNDVLGELEPIHKKYLAMFENPPSSIKRARDPSSGGTRKNRRTQRKNRTSY
jgi:hypothetical protein